MNTVRQRVLWGLGWSGATQILGQAVQFILSIILARLLSPRDFGLIAMVLIFTGFASSLADMGLGSSLVQRREISDRHLNAVFWVNVTVGGLLTILFALLAPLIAGFYREPLLRWLTAAIALNFFLASLNTVQDALLDRSLDFRTKFRVESVSLAGSGLAALVLALAGAGVWSLVGQPLARTTLRVAAMWHLSSWRPSRSFDVSSLRELMRFGRHLMGCGIMYYWGTNLDKLIMGRVLGSAALGIYGLADKLMQLPVANVTGITHAVMFPALSAMQDDVESVRRAYLRATRMIALITFPMMIGLGILAEPAILVVYGDQWREAIGVFQVLCAAGLAHSVYFTGGWIFLSRGRSDLLFWWTTYAAIVRVVGILIGVQWGILGAALAYAVGSYVFIGYPSWASAGRLVNLGMREILRNLAGPFSSAVVMGVLLWISDRWMFASQPLEVRLVVQALSGALLYGLLIRQFRLEAWQDIQKVVLDFGGGQCRLIAWLVGGTQRAKS